MTIEARRIPRGVGAILLALALIFIAAVPTAMADTIYPDNKITGASFDAGLDGWTEFTNECAAARHRAPTAAVRDSYRARSRHRNASGLAGAARRQDG